jgi:pimeloyl-ACP methyl ester carboxylesterase
VTAQTVDTLININEGLKMHFTIIKGKGVPILFESGSGDDGSIWESITQQIADVTGAAIITYDRIGFGKNSQSSPIGFGNEIKALEMGLQKLGFANRNIMLVSHSIGGMYNSYFASRHPNEVKAVVLIDAANACAWTSIFKNQENLERFAKEGNDLKDLTNILDTVLKNPMPLHIPIVDIVAENQLSDDNRDSSSYKTWFSCHHNFVSQSPYRKSLLAYGVGHAVFIENKPLVINVIATQYANYMAPEQKTVILEKGYALALKMVNESHKNELKCGRSENDLNEWGYALIGKNEMQKAIEIFKLNITLYPNSWNAYDSLGEAYQKAGHKNLAIKNYKKSLELNPENDNAVKMLKQILK